MLELHFEGRDRESLCEQEKQQSYQGERALILSNAECSVGTKVEELFLDQHKEKNFSCSAFLMLVIHP